MKLYRQGDLLFKKIRYIPREDRKKRENGHILEGETTGHIHRIAELDRAEVLEIGQDLYLHVTGEGGVSIVHEDHAKVTLPPGNYEITRQREYDPARNRKVAD